MLPQRQLITRDGKNEISGYKTRAEEWEWKGSAFHFPREAKKFRFLCEVSRFFSVGD